MSDQPKRFTKHGQLSQARRQRKGETPGRLHRRTITILSREVERMMDKSFVEGLTPQESKVLIDYMKFIQELKALADLEAKPEAGETKG